MRNLQRKYYKSHDRNDLLAAKAAEYEIDTLLEAYGFVDDKKKTKKAATSVSTQKSLF